MSFLDPCLQLTRHTALGLLGTFALHSTPHHQMSLEELKMKILSVVQQPDDREVVCHHMKNV